MKMHEGEETSLGSGARPDARLRMAYCEYRGRYYGSKMKTLAGYVVVGNFGYCIVGVYAESNEEMEKVIWQCMESFERRPDC
jgi:hypothetical protein